METMVMERWFGYMVQCSAYDFDRAMLEVLEQNAEGLEPIVEEYHQWLDTIEAMAKLLDIDFESIREATTWVPAAHQVYDTKVHNYGIDFAVKSQEIYDTVCSKYKEFEVSGGYTFEGNGKDLADVQLEVPTKEQVLAIYAELKEMVDEEKGEYVSWYALNAYGFQVEVK